MPNNNNNKTNIKRGGNMRQPELTILLQKLYKKTGIKHKGVYLCSSALQDIASMLGISPYKGWYKELCKEVMTEMAMPYSDRDFNANGMLRSHPSKKLIALFLKRGQTSREQSPTRYESLSKASIKDCLCALIGSEFRQYMGTREGDFYLTQKSLLKMLSLMVPQAEKYRQRSYSDVTIAILSELGERHDDVRLESRQPVAISMRIACSFLRQSPSFIDGAEERLKQVTLRKKGAHTIKRRAAYTTLQKPEPKPEPKPTPAKGRDLVQILQHLSELGNVTVFNMDNMKQITVTIALHNIQGG